MVGNEGMGLAVPEQEKSLQQAQISVDDALDLIQKTSFSVSTGWGLGLGLEYSGVDLTEPLMYTVVEMLNKQLMFYYFPPLEEKVQEVQVQEGQDEGG